LRNKIETSNLPKNLKEALIKELTLPNPVYEENVKQGYSTWNVKPHILNFSVLPNGNLLLPRGYRSSLIQLLNDNHLDFEVKDERTNFDYTHLDVRVRLRPYQESSLKELVSSGATEGLIVAPAGSGKTVIGISMMGVFGQPVLWLTHTGQLATQAVERITSFMSIDKKDIGFIGGGKWSIGNEVTVAMVQTLAKRLDTLYKIMDKFGLVILDEAHHCPARIFTDVITNFNPRYLFGLTATPYRRDGLQTLMYQVLGPEIVRISQEDVRKQGGIMSPKVYYKTIQSAYVDGNNINTIIKNHIINNKKRNRLIVSDVLAEAHAGNFCIVVSDRRKHCEILYDLISPGWAKTGVATGKYSRKYVEEQVQRYLDGEITVLITTFALLGEGFDIDFLNRAFITTPFRSEAKAEQLVGRIQRVAENKTDAIIYDYVDHNIGVLRNQFYTGKDHKPCRYNVYKRLGLEVIPL